MEQTEHYVTVSEHLNIFLLCQLQKVLFASKKPTEKVSAANIWGVNFNEPCRQSVSRWRVWILYSLGII